MRPPSGSRGFALSDTLRLRLTGAWYAEDPGSEFNADGDEVDLGAHTSFH